MTSIMATTKAADTLTPLYYAAIRHALIILLTHYSYTEDSSDQRCSDEGSCSLSARVNHHAATVETGLKI
jgi:hypothetical protein